MISAKSLKNIMYSPEFVARLLHRFLSGSQAVKQDGIKYELMYLLLPIVMNDKLRKSLEGVNTKSVFDKVILSNENKYEIYYFDEYIENTRNITNNGLIYLSSYIDLSIGSYLKANELVNFKCNEKRLQEHYRAAYYLGLLLSKEDYLNVFLKTKVKCI